MTDSHALETIRNGLHSEDVEDRKEALGSLYENKPDDWTALEPLVDDLIDVLDDDPFVREGAALTLQRIGSLDTDQVARVTDSLDHDQPFSGYRAVDVLFGLSEDSPEIVASVIPSIVEFVVVRDRMADDDSSDEAETDGAETDANAEANDPPDEPPETELTTDEDGVPIVEHESLTTRKPHAQRRLQAVGVLSNVSDHDPSSLRPAVTDLVAATARDDHAQIRVELLGLLAGIAETQPEAFEAAIEPVSEILGTTDDQNIRANATFLLAMIAETDQSAVTTAVHPHCDTLIEMLESDHEIAQSAAVGLFSYVAEEQPDAIEPATETVLDLLEHPQESVRGNAIWTLSYIDGDDVVDRLETVAAEDPSEHIREHAAETRSALVSE